MGVYRLIDIDPNARIPMPLDIPQISSVGVRRAVYCSAELTSRALRQTSVARVPEAFCGHGLCSLYRACICEPNGGGERGKPFGGAIDGAIVSTRNDVDRARDLCRNPACSAGPYGRGAGVVVGILRLVHAAGLVP